MRPHAPTLLLLLLGVLLCAPAWSASPPWKALSKSGMAAAKAGDMELALSKLGDALAMQRGSSWTTAQRGTPQSAKQEGKLLVNIGVVLLRRGLQAVEDADEAAAVAKLQLSEASFREALEVHPTNEAAQRNLVVVVAELAKRSTDGASPGGSSGGAQACGEGGVCAADWRPQDGEEGGGAGGADGGANGEDSVSWHAAMDAVASSPGGRKLLRSIGAAARKANVQETDPDSHHATAIAHANKGDFKRCVTFFKAKALLHGDKEPLATGLTLTNLGTALMDWARTVHMEGEADAAWDVCKASAKAFEAAIAYLRGGDLESTFYGNLESLHKLMTSQFASRIQGGECRLPLCPFAPEPAGAGGAKGRKRRKALKARMREWRAAKAAVGNGVLPGRWTPASKDPLCSPEALRVKVRPQERAAGVLMREKWEQASATFTECGALVLEGAYDVATIRRLHSFQKVEFEAAQKSGIQGLSTETVKAGKTGRFNTKAPYRTPYTDRSYVDNPIVTSVLSAGMGGVGSKEIKIATLSHVTSLPGSPHGNWHEDHGS